MANSQLSNNALELNRDNAGNAYITVASNDSTLVLQTTTIGGSQTTGLTINSVGGVDVPTTLTVPDDAYGAGWNGSNQVPTKNAIYDQIESLGAGSNGKVVQMGYFSDGTTYNLPTSTWGVCSVATNIDAVSANSTLYVFAIADMYAQQPATNNSAQAYARIYFYDGTAYTAIGQPGYNYIAGTGLTSVNLRVPTSLNAKLAKSQQRSDVGGNGRWTIRLYGYEGSGDTSTCQAWNAIYLEIEN